MAAVTVAKGVRRPRKIDRGNFLGNVKQRLPLPLLA